MAVLLAVPSVVTVSFHEPVYAQDAPAAEPSPEDIEQATSHFEKGAGFFEEKKFALALEEFKESYAKVASPNSHLFIARCLVELGDLAAAYMEFGKVVDEAEARAVAEPKYAPTGEAAKAERNDVAAKIALVTLNVSTDEAGATVTLGGRAIDRDQWGTAIPVDPGTAEFVLSAPDKTPVTQSLQLAAGEKRDVSLSFEDDSGSSSAPTADAPSGSGMSPRSLRPFAYAAAGVGAAGFITFAVAGGISTATYSDLEETCGGPCPESKADDVKAGKTQQTVANVGLVIGLVGVAAGTTLFVLSLRKPKQSETTTSLVLGPASVGLQGRF